MEFEDLDPQTQLDKLTTTHKATTDALVAHHNKEMAAVNAKLANEQKQNQLEDLVRKSGPFVDDRAVCKLIGEQFKVEEGSLQAVNGQRPEAIFKAFVREYPFMVKEAGTTTNESTGKHRLEDIFGKGSSGKKAAALMAENPSEYRRLRSLAKSKGLIG